MESHHMKRRGLDRTALTLLLRTGEFGVWADFGALGAMLLVAVTFAWSSSFSTSPSSTNFCRSTAASSLLSIRLSAENLARINFCNSSPECSIQVDWATVRRRIFNFIYKTTDGNGEEKIIILLWIDRIVKVMMALWRFDVSLFTFWHLTAHFRFRASHIAHSQIKSFWIRMKTINHGFELTAEICPGKCSKSQRHKERWRKKNASVPGFSLYIYSLGEEAIRSFICTIWNNRIRVHQQLQRRTEQRWFHKWCDREYLLSTKRANEGSTEISENWNRFYFALIWMGSIRHLLGIIYVSSRMMVVKPWLFNCTYEMEKVVYESKELYNRCG